MPARKARASLTECLFLDAFMKRQSHHFSLACTHAVLMPLINDDNRRLTRINGVTTDASSELYDERLDYDMPITSVMRMMKSRRVSGKNLKPARPHPPSALGNAEECRPSHDHRRTRLPQNDCFIDAARCQDRLRCLSPHIATSAAVEIDYTAGLFRRYCEK